jgi:hypothetical protein
MTAGRSYESAFVEREEVAGVGGLTATQKAPCEVSLKVLYIYKYLSIRVWIFIEFLNKIFINF